MTKDITVDIENMDERSRDEYFMSIAMEEARKAYDLGEIPIGAILVKDNTIVSRHHNRRELDHDATAHAEV
ncbi:MAG: deaminase, partial [Veillonella sp.]|nr:deaminase [Veillonella sp.]